MSEQVTGQTGKMSVLVLSYRSFSEHEVGFPDPLVWAADSDAAGEEGAE